MQFLYIFYRPRSQAGYPHTVFRFPFRRADHSSQISKTVYTAAEMLQLLEATKEEGHLYNLFLRNIESIEVWLHQAGKICISDDIVLDIFVLRSSTKRREPLHQLFCSVSKRSHSPWIG